MESSSLIAVIGDIHAQGRALARVLERVRKRRADGILLVGDFACAGHRRQRTLAGGAQYLCEVNAIFAQVNELGIPVQYVPGNHDKPDLRMPGNIDGQVRELAGVTVAGIGGAGPDIFGFPYEWPEDDIRALPSLCADILLSHCPPRNTDLDKTWKGAHVGSDAIRERVELPIADGGPKVMVCGHIHESAGVVQIGECLSMNVGALGAPFPRVQVGFVEGFDRVILEDLEDGKHRILSRRLPSAR